MASPQKLPADLRKAHFDNTTVFQTDVGPVIVIADQTSEWMDVQADAGTIHFDTNASGTDPDIIIYGNSKVVGTSEVTGNTTIGGALAITGNTTISGAMTLTVGWEVGVPLTSVLPLTNTLVTTLSGLNSGTKPSLTFSSGDTDSAMVITWAASEKYSVAFNVTLPTTTITTSKIVIDVLAHMSGHTDTPTVYASTYFGIGDTKISDGVEILTGTAALYRINIAASDIPASPQMMTVKLYTGPHATDKVQIYAIRVRGRKSL
jgi:hypothetical protein